MVKTITESRVSEKEYEMNKVISSLSDKDVLEMWNDFCRVTRNNEDIIYENTKENVLRVFKPDNIWDAICTIKHCDWNDDDTYFKAYNNKLSGTKYFRSLMRTYNLIDYIIENDEDFGHKEIRKVLNLF